MVFNVYPHLKPRQTNNSGDQYVSRYFFHSDMIVWITHSNTSLPLAFEFFEKFEVISNGH